MADARQNSGMGNGRSSGPSDAGSGAGSRPASGPASGLGAAQGRVQIAVRPLFPTPIAIFDVPGAPQINAALTARILAREASVPSVQHSNLGGWQSPPDFETWGGPEGAAVLETARHIATQLTTDRDGRPARVAWRMGAWANVNRSGQANEFHTHPGSFWSATYYVQDGGAGSDPALGGEFEMQDPRGVAPAMLAPGLCFRIQGGLSAGASETIRPVAGTLILFPSWLSHAVRPYRGTDVRISIAMNFSPA